MGLARFNSTTGGNHMRIQTWISTAVIIILAVAAFLWFYPAGDQTPGQPAPHALDQSN
jgi:hypothetical protein